MVLNIKLQNSWSDLPAIPAPIRVWLTRYPISGFPLGMQNLDNKSRHGKVMEIENPEKSRGKLKLVMQNWGFLISM